MSILVTGGAGYIGSVTVGALRAKGQKVVVLDDLYRGYRATVPADVPFYEGKVGDRALVARIVAEHAVDACIHFAALIEVGESVAQPAKYYENNVEQGIALLGALREAGVLRFVLSSTAAVYGEPDRVPIPEDARLWPKNPYGWSKLMMERILDSYDHAYGMKFAALRYFNASGATKTLGENHQPESHLIPNVLAAAAGEKKELSVYGNAYPTPDGTPIRDYVHVLDLAEAHVLALGHLSTKRESISMNLGTEHGYSVLEVIETARKITGKPIPMRIVEARAGDPARLVADATKAHTVLGWKPAHSDLASILGSQWEWRQSHPRGYAK